MKESSGWNFNHSTENEATLKPLCLEVEKHFHLPARRLYRYFARTDDPSLEGPPMCLGKYYRGFHPTLRQERLAEVPVRLFLSSPRKVPGACSL